MITVWELKSVDGTQVVIKAFASRDDDYMYQHEYQRILYRGSRDRALQYLDDLACE